MPLKFWQKFKRRRKVKYVTPTDSATVYVFLLINDPAKFIYNETMTHYYTENSGTKIEQYRAHIDIEVQYLVDTHQATLRSEPYLIYYLQNDGILVPFDRDPSLMSKEMIKTRLVVTNHIFESDLIMRSTYDIPDFHTVFKI